MKANEQNAPRDAREDDFIVLGVASIETKGDLKRQESIGGSLPVGISVL